MEKDTIIKVTNRSGHSVGYKVPELGVNRQFANRQTREIPFEELEQLSFLPGGIRMLTNYLVIKDADAIEALGLKVEPEYFYTEEEVKELMLKGTLNEFLDCLDFAPDGVLDIVKKLAVELPLNDVSKRNAIQEKLGFNVGKAIEIKNMKTDGDADSGSEEEKSSVRRTATPTPEGVRRAAPPKYKVTSIKED